MKRFLWIVGIVIVVAVLIIPNRVQADTCDTSDPGYCACIGGSGSVGNGNCYGGCPDGTQQVGNWDCFQCNVNCAGHLCNTSDPGYCGCIGGQGSVGNGNCPGTCPDGTSTTGDWDCFNCNNLKCAGHTCSANNGQTCNSLPNSCGDTNTGTTQCDGTCSANPPSNPRNYGKICFSNPNACGQKNQGVIDCSLQCNAVTPPDSNCPTTGCPSPVTTVVNNPDHNAAFCGCPPGQVAPAFLTCTSANDGSGPYGPACTPAGCTPGCSCNCPAGQTFDANGNCIPDDCAHTGAQTCGGGQFCTNNVCGCPPPVTKVVTDIAQNTAYCKCTGGKVGPASLTCTSAINDWAPYGPSCTPQGCTPDCSCTCPAGQQDDGTGKCIKPNVCTVGDLTQCGSGTCAPWEYQQCQKQTDGSTDWSSCNSSCSGWTNVAKGCGLAGDYANGHVDCSGATPHMLQTSSCACPGSTSGTSNSTVLAQCGAACTLPGLPTATISVAGSAPYLIGQMITVQASGTDSSGGIQVDMSGDGSCSNNFGFCAVQVNLGTARTYTFTAIATNSNGTSTPATVSVTAMPPPSLTLNPTSASVPLNGSQGFVVSVTQPDGTPYPSPLPAIAWSSTGCGGLTSSGQSATYQAPASIGTATTCTASVSAAIGNVTVSAAITVKNITLSVTPTSASIQLGKTAGFSVAATGGAVPQDFNWAITGGACTTQNATNTGVTVQAPNQAGTCTLNGSSASLAFSQNMQIFISSNPIQSLSISPPSATMTPNSSLQFTIQGADKNGVVVNLPPGWGAAMSGTGNCSITSTEGSAFQAAYVFVQAGTIPNTACTLTVTAGNISANAQIKVSNSLVHILSPADKSSLVLNGPSAAISITGTSAGGNSVSLSGSVSGAASVGAPDATGLASWSYTWSQSNGLTPGLKTIVATLGTGTQPPTDQSSFGVFGWPPPPVLTVSAPVSYTGTTIKIMATASDNTANPTTGPGQGIANIFLTGAFGSGPMQNSPSGWIFPITSTGRGSYQYTARSLNNAGAYSINPSAVSFVIQDRPTIVISSPAANSSFTTGSNVNLIATLVDPDRLTQKVEFFLWGQSMGKLTPSGTTATLPWKASVPTGGPFAQIYVAAYYPDLANPGSLLTTISPNIQLIVADPPSVAGGPATANPNPVTGGLMTTLTANATSVFGASMLSYQWTPSASNPAPATFSFNGANQTVDATFSKAGSYSFTATVTDPIGASVKTSTAVIVKAGPQISPSPAFVAVGGSQSFSTTGQDQFGNSLPGSPTWSSNCPTPIGTIDASGHFSGAGLGSCVVSVTVGGMTNAELVNVVNDLPPTVSIASVNPSNPTYTAPMDIVLTASAADADDSVKSVQFYANGTAIGPALGQAPYTYTWHNMLPGNYFVTAIATDQKGATATSASVPVTVAKPKVVITKVTPSVATTQDNTSSNEFIFDVEGSGFVQPTAISGSVITWNGQPTSSVFLSGNILDATFEVHLRNEELLNPETATVQVASPKNPASPSAGTDLSNPYSFVVDGSPIISCLTAGSGGSCQNQNSTNSFGSRISSTGSGLPQLSRSDEVTAVAQYTGGGIQWKLLAGAISNSAAATLSAGLNMSEPVLYMSNYLAGTTFKLSNLPAVSPGPYTLTAQGMNLAGTTSPTASIQIFLAASNLSTARVFPNPWRADQDSAFPIKFDQLPPGTQVKIFTVSGHWVQTLTADSTGTAAWDRRNSGGELVQSGLYLFLATDDHGTKVHGKFSIIR